MSKIVRVLIYEGEAELLSKDLRHWGMVPNGRKSGLQEGRRGKMVVTSQIVKVEDFPCLKCGYFTNSLTLMCEHCLAEAEKAAKEVENVIP